MGRVNFRKRVFVFVFRTRVRTCACVLRRLGRPHRPQPPAATSSGGEEGSEEGEDQDGGGKEGKSGSSASDWLRDAMWSGVMRQLGGEYAALSRFPGDHELIFKHMEQLWDEQNSLLHRRIDMLGEPEGSGSGDKED